MANPEFDAIVVGAGVAGCTAATRLAQEGANVLLVERADEAGAKNLSGGVLWGNDLAAVYPDWKEEAPLERPISNKKVGFLGNESAFVMDFHDESLKTNTLGYSVLRARLDPWLLKKTEEAGANVITGVNVDGLYRERGKIVGVHQGGETTTARTVIVADGANTRLCLEADLRHGAKKLDAHDYALGVKQVLKLDAGVMEDRFGIGPDGGMAGEFILGRQDGVMAGGFLYTNRDTFSLGIVLNLPSLEGAKEVTSHDVVEDFRMHPYIHGLVKDAELVEYGAHLVPEGGYGAFSELYTDGALVAGDAAGFCFSNGIVIQGMNYAAKSGIAAADTALHAKNKGDASKVTLRHYEKALHDVHVVQDFKKFANVNKALWNPRMFTHYPDFLAGIFRNMLNAEGPKKKTKEHVFAAMADAGISKRQILQDGITMGVNL